MALMKVIQKILFVGALVGSFSLGYGTPLTAFPACCTGIAQNNYPCEDPSGGTGSWARSQCLYGCATHCAPGSPPDFSNPSYVACRSACISLYP